MSGDSDKVGVGIGSVGSCETTVTGTAIVHCARIIIEKGRLEKLKKRGEVEE